MPPLFNNRKLFLQKNHNFVDSSQEPLLSLFILAKIEDLNLYMLTVLGI